MKGLPLLSNLGQLKYDLYPSLSYLTAPTGAGDKSHFPWTSDDIFPE